VNAPEDQLAEAVRSSPWMMRVLRTVREAALPDAWVGAGALRDLVWGDRYGSGFTPGHLRDVDVAFFDPHDLTRANDTRATERLRERAPDVPWEATNQAAVHTWYAELFGGAPVPPLRSIAEAVATWPETATAVAARLTPAGTIEVCAPLGADDLLNGIWRHNPRRVSPEQSRRRLERQQPATRWPGVTVVPPP
jgi:uncharacterized protein